MPRKRTHGKRRLDWRAELEAWSTMFECGFAWDGDLMPLGLSPKPEPAVIEEAWKRLGPQFIAARGRRTGTGQALWAIEQFGEPAHAR